MPNPIVEEALARFQICEEAESDTRTDGLEADKFSVGEQWPRNIKQAREVESRPCLTINRLPQFIRQVTNDMRMNRPSVHIVPSRDGTEETASVLEGMVRHIQVASNADVAYDTAGESAVRKGWGYFRLTTEYADENTFDQDIRIKRIKNAFSVYFDPECVEPDYSDAKYAFIVKDMTQEEYKRAFPKSKMASSMAEFSSVGDTTPDWMSGKVVRVAEYFKIVEKEDTLCMMPDGSTMLKSKMPEGGDKFVKDSRKTTIRSVKWYLINGIEVLEEREWVGKWIPIIPVLGEDLDIDGKRYLRGMVYGAMDAQRQYNYMSTAQTEAIALSPKAPFIGAVGQFENLETYWQNANLQNFAYLPYNPVDVNGNALPPPRRDQAEPPVQAMVQATSKAAEDMKGTIGIYDAGLGNRSNETSGRAIMARQKEGDVANFHYVDNLSRAIRFLGVQLVDLIPKIYDAPRVVRIVKEDDTTEEVHVNTPLDPNGKPIEGGFDKAVSKIYDLTTGKYDVVVDVGPSFSTKRKETADAMLSLVQSDPSLMQKAGDMIVKNLDFPQANDLSTRLKMFLPPEVQDDKGKDIPATAKAQMAQMGQMIEQLTQQLNAAHDEIGQKTAEVESRERIALMNNGNKVVVEAMKQEGSASLELMRAELATISAKLNALTEPVAPTSTPIDMGAEGANIQQDAAVAL